MNEREVYYFSIKDLIMQFFTRKLTHIVEVINKISFLPTVVLLVLCQLAAVFRKLGQLHFSKEEQKFKKPTRIS